MVTVGIYQGGMIVLWLSGDTIEVSMDYGWKNRNDGCNHVGAYSNG